MKVGIVGVGKLGFPYAVALAARGAEVLAYDADPRLHGSYEPRSMENGFTREPFEQLVKAHYRRIKYGALADLVQQSDVILVMVQTPHDPLYDGTRLLSDDRKDFDYTYLKQAVRSIVGTLGDSTGKLLVIVSTVLPGTTRKQIMPIVGDKMRVVYSPSFIAMGTTIMDLTMPEFVLIGKDKGTEDIELRKMWHYLSMSVRFLDMRIESAELTKVSYNTFIGFKIAFCNLLAEASDCVGADVDEVTGALGSARDRLASNKYMRAGMGDGGACHPRDNIALSWFCKERGLSYDLFSSVMEAREHQAKLLAQMLIDHSQSGRRAVILGYAYKAESNLIHGSHALLVERIYNSMGDKVAKFDPYVDPRGWASGLPLDKPIVGLIGCPHNLVLDAAYPAGSTIIDPWRMYKGPKENIEYIGIGAQS